MDKCGIVHFDLFAYLQFSIHKRCSGVSGKLSNVSNFHCAKCVRCSPVRFEELKEISLGTDLRLECVVKFCYLGDVVGAGGGAEDASRARVRSAWANWLQS